MRLVALVGVLSSTAALAQGAAAPPKPGDMINNPPYSAWAQFKVGASSTVKDTVTLPDGSTVESTISSRLVAKSKDGVKVETVNTLAVTGTQDHEKASTVSFYPAVINFEATQSPPAAGYNVAEGKETLEINGKKVETEWVEDTSSNCDESTVEKAWTAREVPGGMVKRTMIQKKGTESVTTATVLVSYEGKLEPSKK
jgi:hypothetical protein